MTYLYFESMQSTHLDQIIEIENAAYSHPWNRQNFVDSLNAKYGAYILWIGDDDSNSNINLHYLDIKNQLKNDVENNIKNKIENNLHHLNDFHTQDYPILAAYFVAMNGVDETHLLNITVSPKWQKCGLAYLLLNKLILWSHEQNARSLLLEVRQSNIQALTLYEKNGFVQIGIRKNYYQAENGQREHAIVMCLLLQK